MSNQGPQQPPAPAQITFTSSLFTSPIFLGAIVTLIASIASAFGVHVLDSEAMQQQAILVLGVIITGILHWAFPNADGKLSASAPAAWNNPSPVPVQTGASAISVPHPEDANQAATVVPLDIGTHTIEIAQPAPTAPPTIVSVTPQ